MTTTWGLLEATSKGLTGGRAERVSAETASKGSTFFWGGWGGGSRGLREITSKWLPGREGRGGAGLLETVSKGVTQGRGDRMRAG